MTSRREEKVNGEGRRAEGEGWLAGGGESVKGEGQRQGILTRRRRLDIRLKDTQKRARWSVRHEEDLLNSQTKVKRRSEGEGSYRFLQPTMRLTGNPSAPSDISFHMPRGYWSKRGLVVDLKIAVKNGCWQKKWRLKVKRQRINRRKSSPNCFTLYKNSVEKNAMDSE